MLAHTRSTSGETIQNSLNYWNRKQGLLIWSIVERINFLFKWNSRSMYIYVEKLIGNYTLKIMKNTWKFTKKPGKIMEISWNFVSPEKWEPWCLLPGGCLLLRGVCSRGVVSQHALRQTSPPLGTEWLTDRCKNITFATSLRTVIKLSLNLWPNGHTHFRNILLQENKQSTYAQSFQTASLSVDNNSLDRMLLLHVVRGNWGVLYFLDTGKKYSQ